MDSIIDRQLRETITRVDQKLIWIPMVFLLIRVWGNIRLFISIPPFFLCPSKYYCDLLYNSYLIYLQSIGDPGQGWSNAMLFVVFNHKIFKRLCPCLYLCGQRCRGACNVNSLQKKASGDLKQVSVAVKIKKVTKQACQSEHDPLTNDTSSVLYYAMSNGSRSQQINLPDPTPLQ